MSTQLKNEKEILDLVFSIPLEKWTNQFKIEIIRDKEVIVGCELNLNGVSLILDILPFAILRIGPFQYTDDERIWDLGNRVRDEIKKLKYNDGEIILKSLLGAKEQGII